MLRFQFINSNDGKIRIFSYNHLQENSSSIESVCNLNEISEISIRINSLIANINKNLHQRVVLFDQLKIEAFNLYCKCISSLIDNSDNVSKIIFEFDKNLGFIPFELLYNNKYFLSEKFSIIRKINGRKSSKKKNQNNLNENKLSLSGNFGNDLDIRNSTDNELSEIANILEEKNIPFNGPLVGPFPDKQEISNIISSAPILHFSGHFSNLENDFGWKNNSNSVFNINDFKSIPHLPRFVFSNSCGNLANKTNSNFFYDLNEIGIENIIYTTGEINTEFSRKFAILFYTEFTSGNNISDSLKNAKNRFIEKYGYSNPCWLQYNFLGEDDFSLVHKNIKTSSGPILLIFILLSLLTIFSISAVNFKSWYDQKNKNQLLHIIPQNNINKFEIFDTYGHFINPNKQLRVYNDSQITFYSNGFDTLRLHFNITDTSVSIKTESSLQFIYENNLMEVIKIIEDSLFINLTNNGLCEIEISNIAKNQHIYFGFSDFKQSNSRIWRKLINSPTINIDPYFNDKLFLHIIQNNISQYFEYNTKDTICEISLDIKAISEFRSNNWIYLGF